jgi:hypothetical protein
MLSQSPNPIGSELPTVRSPRPTIPSSGLAFPETLSSYTLQLGSGTSKPGFSETVARSQSGAVR